MHPLQTARPRALLAALRPQALPPALLSEAAWGRLDALLARLPDRLGTLYLELRLSGELDRADLMIHVGRHPAPDLAELAAALAPAGPQVRPLAQLLRQATTAGDPLAEALQGAWLEWDLPEGTDARNEAPQLFVSGTADPVNGLGGGGHPALLAALAGLAGRPGAEADADRLSAAQALLPAGGRLVHLGCMTGRPERTLRGVFQVPEAALGPWLRAAGWPGPVATLPEQLGGRVHARRGRLKVDLDLHNGPSARLGVFSELSASGARGHAQAPALLARLVADGLAEPDRAAALLAWPLPRRGGRAPLRAGAAPGPQAGAAGYGRAGSQGLPGASAAALSLGLSRRPPRPLATGGEAPGRRCSPRRDGSPAADLRHGRAPRCPGSRRGRDPCPGPAPWW